MSWFRCMGGGGSEPATKNVSYLKWQILKTRSNPAANTLQIAEFYLYQNGEKYTWDSNVSITSNMAGNTGEDISKLIDGNTSTKYCTNEWGSSQTNECNIVISLGETITLDAHSTYSFCTPNDEISRDPISWKLYGSTDGTNWELLDERNDATVPTDRYRETISFPMSEICGTNIGNATVKQGTFVSASTQYGIVDINVGFEPDLVLVNMPLGNNISTVSYWEKGLSYAQTDAIWCLKPAENVSYQVALDRQTGETGIQAINNDGFSFMSNGANARDVACEYVAVKYEAESIAFEKEILHSIVQDQSANPTPVSVTFTKDYQIAFICGLIADNVRTGAILVNAVGGASALYGISDSRYASAGIATQLPSNKTLIGYFPYSDGGAYYDIFGAIGMNRLPSEYEIQATIDTSSISIELSKVYDHVVVFVGMDSGNSNSITLAMNGTSIPLTVEAIKFDRYAYHASAELTSDSATLNFTYSGGSVADNTIVVFAYNE